MQPESQLPAASTPGDHPEEMRASFRFSLGSLVSVEAAARTTPAGIVATALLVVAAVGTSLWLGRRRV